MSAHVKKRQDRCDAEVAKRLDPVLRPEIAAEIMELRAAVQAYNDDAAVDRFAAAMKERLAQKRAEGRGGWDDPEECSFEHLRDLLENTAIGKPLDIGNFAMMLWNRERTGG